MLSTQTNNSQILIVNSYNFFMNLISGTFYNVLPDLIRKIIVLVSLATIGFFCVAIFCLSIGVLYNFVKESFVASRKNTVINRLKGSMSLVVKKINEPHKDGYWIAKVYKFLPFIALVGFMTPFWPVSISLLPIVIFSNEYVSKKINIKINLWVSIFFLIMAFILFQLLEYSRQI